MKLAALLLLIALFAPHAACAAGAAGSDLAPHAAPAFATQAFDAGLVGQVVGAALAFIAPRTLEPTTPGELALWGLHGIGEIDPALDVVLDGGRLRLRAGPRELFSTPAPAADAATAWGQTVASLEAAAIARSETMRRSSQQDILQGFFDETFNHLDPYSRYIPPDPATEERDRLSGSAGAGLSLVRRRGGLTVADLAPGGPAAAAGVHVGDRVLAVDGRTARGLRADRIVAMLAAPEGSAVTLDLRGLDGARRLVVIDTALVPPDTVASTRDGDLLVLRVSGFAANTAERLSQALEAGMLDPHPPLAVAVDLRGNRGGLLRQAVTAVALFAERGIVASTAGRAPGSSHEFRIEGGDLTNGLPVIVLVDGSSASAAEIMAAALADLHRGVVVGSSTLGKGLVQTITALPDGGELFVTWSRVLAPLGWPLQGLGVLPQVCTSMGEAEAAHELADLDRGQQDLQSALEATRAARAPLPPARMVELRGACPAAEGTDRDLAAAHFLAGHAKAYRAALLTIPHGGGSASDQAGAPCAACLRQDSAQSPR